MTGTKSSFMIIYENILGTFDCYPKSAFLMKSPTFISHKKSDGRKRKRGGVIAMQVAAKRVKYGSLVPRLYLSRHILLKDNAG
ncbi:MAG: hypothetical protein PUE03_00370 [Prevotella sp.]|nr:hypothetical protein [Prevotella sp.]